MILRFQRWLLLAIAAVLLAIPAVPIFVRSDGLRSLVAAGPVSSATLRSEIERLADARLGLGDEMSDAARWIRVLGAAPDGIAVEGKEGWLFLNSPKFRKRIAGTMQSPGPIADWLDFAVRIEQLQRAHGGRLVVAVAPDKASIYPELAPAAYQVRHPDSLDRFQDLLAQRGILFADLRSLLQQHRHLGPLYEPRETHWNQLGSLIAFNGIVAALGETDKQFPVADLLKGFADRPLVGDLAHLRDPAAAPQMVSTPVLDQALYAGVKVFKKDLGTGPNQHAFTRSRWAHSPAGLESAEPPAVLLIGDSFSARLMPPFSQRYPSVQWMAHNMGRNVEVEIGELAADIVVIEVVERLLE
ncbi:hypothetical protein [Hoeflea sp.]|uniref:alginate O-acetyltransferase AlgX-related protein n=1 Tax=Hoeflea sp. TaxID=1940281 RepID=UPI0019AA0F03|nr:hypothetical protein [Hoeflea sp.]MBC7281386.1 hypothetical protein [Hoeflea sp.]